MTGSVQVKKGKWYTVIHLGDRKYKWQSTELTERGNKRKAEQILRERISQFESQKDILINNDLPFYKFMEEWLDVIQTQVEPVTFNGYKFVIQNQIAPYFKSQKVTLRDLQTIHIQKFYAKRLKDGVSANTIKHYHANIHKALNYAVKTRLISYNPASLVELPKKERFEGKYYTDSQVKTLVKAVSGASVESAILLAISCGLRLSEIRGLKWSCVDFEKKTIEIRHTVTGNGKSKIASDKTKNKSSHRTLPLTPGLERHLLELKQKQREMRLLFGNCYIKNDYICVKDNGEEMSGVTITKQFQRIATASGLPKIRFHDLRHTTASFLIADGFNLKEVSEYLGHCDIGTTANIYAHLQFQSKIDMSAKMDERISI